MILVICSVCFSSIPVRWSRSTTYSTPFVVWFQRLASKFPSSQAAKLRIDRNTGYYNLNKSLEQASKRCNSARGVVCRSCVLDIPTAWSHNKRVHAIRCIPLGIRWRRLEGPISVRWQLDKRWMIILDILSGFQLSDCHEPQIISRIVIRLLMRIHGSV